MHLVSCVLYNKIQKSKSKCVHERLMISSVMDFCSLDTMHFRVLLIIIFGYSFHVQLFKHKYLSSEVYPDVGTAASASDARNTHPAGLLCQLRMLNILIQSLLSIALHLGEILGHSKLLQHFISISCQLWVYIDQQCYFHLFGCNRQNYTLSCSKLKCSIIHQAPGWGRLCCGAYSVLSAACSHVCVAVCFSRHCYVLCWGSCPRATDRSACTGGSCMFLSSLGFSQEL